MKEASFEYNGERITIMCCSKCNCKCAHCYISYDGDIDPDVLEEMCEKLGKKYKLIINGTEVLLNPGYLKSLRISKQNRVLTNGIVIHNNPELLKQVYDTGTKSVALSYHYGIHNNISSVAYQTIVDDIKAIKDAGLDVTLMCTISSGNYNKILEICEEVLKLGVHHIRFFNYLKIGNAINLPDDNVLSQEQLKVFFEQLELARKKYPKDILKIKRNGTFGEDLKCNKNNFECAAGYEEVVIAPNMKVYPCIYMTKEGYEIGEYNNGNILLYNKPTHDRKRCLVREKYNYGNEIEF